MLQPPTVGHPLTISEFCSGRPISTSFLTLPNKVRGRFCCTLKQLNADRFHRQNQLPEYYKEIVLPIAIDTVEVRANVGQCGSHPLSMPVELCLWRIVQRQIPRYLDLTYEQIITLWQSAVHIANISVVANFSFSQAKLNRREYPTLTTVESDIKRMVTNAKSFNERSSEVFADAERIRKLLANFMSKHNVAYKDPNYVPFPTPLPGRTEGGDKDLDADGDSGPELVNSKVQKLSTFVGSTPGPGKRADGRTASSTPVVEDAEGAGESFVGDTFQLAQEKILTELIHLKDDE